MATGSHKNTWIQLRDENPLSHGKDRMKYQPMTVNKSINEYNCWKSKGNELWRPELRGPS